MDSAPVEPNPIVVLAGALSVLAIPFIVKGTLAQSNARNRSRLTRVLRRH